jgi:tetrahydromethanopterin S-methyltransferase subunit F
VPRWLERSRHRAGELKAEGEAESGLRMETFRRVDSVRETEQIRAARARALEGKQVLAISGIAAGIFLVLILVLAVASLH